MIIAAKLTTSCEVGPGISENSLFFPCYQGKSSRDRFVTDCVRHHPISDELTALCTLSNGFGNPASVGVLIIHDMTIRFTATVDDYGDRCAARPVVVKLRLAVAIDRAWNAFSLTVTYLAFNLLKFTVCQNIDDRFVKSHTAAD